MPEEQRSSQHVTPSASVWAPCSAPPRTRCPGLWDSSLDSSVGDVGKGVVLVLVHREWLPTRCLRVLPTAC